MKLLIMPSNLKQTKLHCDGVIIGIKDLSVNMPNYYELKDLKKIKKEIFVALNKNMFNSDLKLLEDTLVKLNDHHIKAVIFYDIAVVNLAKRLNLNYDLVWNQEHMTTNYDTVNFWYKMGAKYSYISSDITLREMIEIKENTKSTLLVNLFGYIPMFDSKRTLLTNYLKTFSLKNDSDKNYLKKEGNTYPIVEDKATTLYSSFILNGLDESLELNYEYGVLNSFLIDDKNFKKVVNIFKKVNNKNLNTYNKKLNDMFDNLGKGFFYEDTVYKVK